MGWQLGALLFAALAGRDYVIGKDDWWFMALLALALMWRSRIAA